MKKLQPTYVCTLCKGGFQFEDMRYSEDGKNLVCKPCYSLAIKLKKKKTETATDKKNKGPGLNKFVCNDCGYRFSLKNTSRASLICPYCGRSKVGPDFFTAEKLVSEASRGIYDTL